MLFAQFFFFSWIYLQISSTEILDFQTICQAGIRQDNTNYIHCGRKQLQTIPTFTRITNTFYDELVLNDNQITSIPSNAFRGLRVKRLNLSGNKIRSISSSAFRELSNYLEELIIEFDSTFFTEIPQAIQNNLINLRSLKLINLNLSKLVNRTFVNFRKLEQLTIQKSQIKSLEFDAFYSLTNLRYLNLDQNQLDDSSWFALTRHLHHLEHLSLNQNHFQTLHRTSSNSLKSLDLSSNGLQHIDQRLDEYLEKLDLQNNELNSLQLSFLPSLKYLKELNLDFNRLTFLPEKIFQTNLQLNYLSLQGNDLNQLTNWTFFGLKNLLHLNLARNRLQFVDNHRPFQYFHSLKILNLDRNLQMNLSKFVLDDLNESLIELSVQNCNLTEWNESFQSFRHLQRLRFSSNLLKNLPKNFLSISLISLDLQRNQFDRLPILIESNSSNLFDLDLSSNQISTLNRNDLFVYPNLKTIGLTNNPLICDCHLTWIRQWLVDNYDQDLIRFLQWTCAKPNELNGKQLTTIPTEDMYCDEQQQQQIQTLKARDELILDEIEYKSDGKLLVSWKDFRLIQSNSYHIKIYDDKQELLLFDRLISDRKHSVEINLFDFIDIFPSIIYICILDRTICRKVILPSNLIQSTSNEQFIYVILGLLLGAIIICTILILICYSRLHSFRKQEEQTQSVTKTCLYHTLTHTYPQHESNRTSECSLHSSTDVTEPYHFYQPIHSTRTHIYI